MRQRRFAAEEVIHPGDVGQQPVGAVPRHEGGIPYCPAAQGFQKGRLGAQIGRAGGQRGADRARIHQGHSAMQPRLFGGAVQAVQMIGIARPQAEREGPVMRAPAQRHLARQPGQPQGQNAPVPCQ